MRVELLVQLSAFQQIWHMNRKTLFKEKTPLNEGAAADIMFPGCSEISVFLYGWEVNTSDRTVVKDFYYTGEVREKWKRISSSSLLLPRAGPGGRIAEMTQKLIKTNLYFKFPTTADVFWGWGGDFHPECNTAVDSPCHGEVRISSCASRTRIWPWIIVPEFDHPLLCQWNPGTKTGVPEILCPPLIKLKFK